VEDLDKPSPRWNEGLAMFLQYRMAAQLDAWAAWDARLDRSAKSIQRVCQGSTACANVPFADYGKAELTDLSYSVGFAMFDALYTTLGPTAFDAAYRDFYQRYTATGATGADLQAAFHRASPASDKIFSEWYLTTGWYSRLSGGESLRQIVSGYPQQ
jgi:aminopeptidase N